MVAEFFHFISVKKVNQRVARASRICSKLVMSDDEQ